MSSVIARCCCFSTLEPVFPKPCLSDHRLLRLDRPRQVRLLGKGNKERICPLWPETATALRRLIRADGSDKPLFENATGHRPLSRDGVAYVIKKHASAAAEMPGTTEAST